ncbi:SGNH/GDSL hydrolase family protein [Fodinicola feengrottensis]|uniref:SGNH/GDSL hydrolase family protein n=1 Tax=Fodinicola feengrottensis TaxID=435914 RepID=UPI0013D2B824|nr:SGNH/GDSL hydrolase family protein [Fodinicola feengrottensis]
MQTRQWRSFVALGDSFTEGLDDPRDGGYAGWADRLAEQLAILTTDFRYANLAIRGKRLDDIVTEQVPVAATMKPDLVAFVGGGNDVLRARVTFSELHAKLAGGVKTLIDAGATVLVCTGTTFAQRLPLAKLVASRSDGMNEVIRAVAHEYGCILVDPWDGEEQGNQHYFSVDRLHLSAAGHQRVAGQALAALGLSYDPQWLKPLPAADWPGWLAARRSDLAWARRHLAPWMGRRLAGRSSGDDVTAKRPELAPVPMPAAPTWPSLPMLLTEPIFC